MKSSRRLLGCVALGLLALSCTDRRQRMQAQRQKERAEERRRAYLPPRAGPTNPGVSARARATVAAREEAAKTGKLLTILFSSNLDGEYDAQPLGGLARRATLVAKTRAAPGSVVHVDAGDSLLPRIPATGEPPPDPKEVDRRAKLMATGLGRLTLDAVTPGENELAMGTAKLKSLVKSAQPADDLVQPEGRPRQAPVRTVQDHPDPGAEDRTLRRHHPGRRRRGQATAARHHRGGSGGSGSGLDHSPAREEGPGGDRPFPCRRWALGGPAN